MEIQVKYVKIPLIIYRCPHVVKVKRHGRVVSLEGRRKDKKPEGSKVFVRFCLKKKII